MLSADELSEVFYYDETSPSGLRWKTNVPYRNAQGVYSVYKVLAGDTAGTYNKAENRYTVRYQQKCYRAHRIVYMLHHGPIPDGMVIDHIDGNSANNCISNLRVVSPVANRQNQRMRDDNKTGATGVYSHEVIDKKSGILYKYFVAMWSIAGKVHRKNYSVVKLGEDKAFQMACDYRDKMIEELNKQGAGYTERHGT